MMAITYNNHALLRFFLSKYDGRLECGSFLCEIAQHADSEMMDILTEFQRLDLICDTRTHSDTALWCRRDYNDALQYAFDNHMFSANGKSGPLDA